MPKSTTVIVVGAVAGLAAAAYFLLRPRAAAASNNSLYNKLQGTSSPSNMAADPIAAYESAQKGGGYAGGAFALSKPGMSEILVGSVAATPPGVNKFGGDQGDPRIAGGEYLNDNGQVCTYDREKGHTSCAGGNPGGWFAGIQKVLGK